MVVGRRHLYSLVAGLLCAGHLGAQGATGTVSGRVVEAVSQQPLSSVNVVVVGTVRGAVTQSDGSFLIIGVPVGAQVVRASRIGFAPLQQAATVSEGTTATVQFALTAQAAVLSEVVSIGYGTQRREAITGSVATVDADQANVGVVTNANQMLQGRVAGVSITANSGEPGAGSQIRIRGGTSINASNDPLYVVDGVPLQNEQASPGAAGIGGIRGALGRNPLNSINPNDIESITTLKDASATAIYGSRGANGVILITTKRGGASAGTMEYDTYVGAAHATKRLGFASGDQYRTYIGQQVAAGKLPATASSSLGTANTDWEDELMRTGYVSSHNLAFSGGSEVTQYRASLNYFDQKGVVLSSGLKRYQGRLNAQHNALSGRLRLGLNLMASRVNNDYAPTENTGGFDGGLFTNMAIYNPTFPVRANGSFYEVSNTALGVRNPVALALQYEDDSPENRVLGNVTGGLTLMENLTASTSLGIDYTDAVRRTFAPRASSIGAGFNGFARQAQRGLQNLNFQQLLTYSPRFGEQNEFEVVGGYEYSEYETRGFEARTQGFITDAFGVNNLGAGTAATSSLPTSYRVESKLVSFFSRAQYGFANRYFLDGVVRYDGSSRLAPGNQWEVFPAVSASWRISEEPMFAQGMPMRLSTLALRAGWGKQGNQSVSPYQTQILLRSDPGATYPFGNVLTSGLRAAQVGNPDLRWETSTQTNVGIDYGMMNDRITGSFEVYEKKTKDLLLEVSVPQPAVVSSRIENVGSLRNRGLEASIDARLWEQPRRSLSGGLVLAVERNRVTNLGERKSISTSDVSGQGQSGQYAQRIMVGEPLGTFFGPRFLSVNGSGQQEFACKAASPGCVNGRTTSPTEADKEIIGSANPSFTLGLNNNATWNGFDASWLWRGEFGRDVFNNTSLVYASKGNATQGRNFLAEALSMPDGLREPAKFSSRWVENGRFIRLQNATIGYTFSNLPSRLGVRGTRVYLSGDNLLLFTPYSGYDPEVFVASGLASRNVDYLTYPRPRTYTLGARLQF